MRPVIRQQLKKNNWGSMSSLDTTEKLNQVNKLYPNHKFQIHVSCGAFTLTSFVCVDCNFWCDERVITFYPPISNCN